MKTIIQIPHAMASDDPEDWAMLAGLVASGYEAHDIRLSLIEKRQLGLAEMGFVDRVFCANGWEWPQL